jgi:1-acyl-sn-glycerol-3-phosphate acyltransferase
MFRYISMFIFKLLGWKVIDKRPKAAGSAVYEGSAIYLVVPHSSNWDFFLGIMVRSVARIHANYLAKKSLFDGPFGWFYRALGGYPVDRSKNTNLTDQVVAYFKTVRGFPSPLHRKARARRWKNGRPVFGGSPKRQMCP